MWLIAACGPPAEPSGVTEVDSAGVSIVQSRGAAWSSDDAWRIESEPVLTLGTVDGAGPTAFGCITDVILVDGGRVAVADALASQVHVFTLAGEHVASLGGPGEGPGEFSDVSQLQFIGGDSVLIWDRDLRRLSRFHLEERFIDTRGLGDVRWDGELAFLDGVAQLESGHLVGREGRDFSGDGLGVTRDTAYFFAIGPDGPAVEIIDRVPGRWTVRTEFEGLNLFRYQPMTPSPRWSVLRDTLYIIAGEHYEVRKVMLDGSKTLLRRDLTPAKVTEEDRALLIEELVAGVPSDQQAQARRLYSSMALPQRLPAYSDVLVDPDGYVWAELFRTPGIGPGKSWDIYAQDGQFLGTVSSPEGLDILDASLDHVAGIWTDDLDVQHIRVHRLIQRDP